MRVDIIIINQNSLNSVVIIVRNTTISFIYFTYSFN
jgi:hypothetical protein